MAIPAILQQLQGSQQASSLQQIKQMYDVCRMAQNPQAVFQNMASQNPEMQKVMNELQRSGGTAKDAFYAIAKSKGINPDDVLAMLK